MNRCDIKKRLGGSFAAALANGYISANGNVHPTDFGYSAIWDAERECLE